MFTTALVVLFRTDIGCILVYVSEIYSMRCDRKYDIQTVSSSAVVKAMQLGDKPGWKLNITSRTAPTRISNTS